MPKLLSEIARLHRIVLRANQLLPCFHVDRRIDGHGADIVIG